MRRAIAILMLAVLAPCPGPAPAAEPAMFVMGIDYDETTFSGGWTRRIYHEVFRRLRLKLEFTVYPTRRLSAEMDRGTLDGEPLRVAAYADAHPNLVRVEEPAFEVVFALYTAKPGLRVGRLEDLGAPNLVAEFRRGVLMCENTLKKWLPTERVSDVVASDQGVKKLLAGRTDVYCEIEWALLDGVLAARPGDASPLRKLLDIGDPLPLHAYVHNRHAALAPRMAAALRQMKAEGLIEQYRIDTAKALDAELLARRLRGEVP